MAVRLDIASLTFWLWVAVLSGGSRCARAAIVEGLLPRDRNSQRFVTKFVYDWNEQRDKTVGEVIVELARSSLEINTTAQPKSGRLLLLIFDDQPDHWKRVQKIWDSSTCQEKSEIAQSTLDMRIDKGRLRAKYSVHIREHVRPRFWYLTFAMCDAEVTEQVRYLVHTENPTMGWQSEFSLDHVGLYTLYLLFSLAFAVGTLATVRASRRPTSPQAPSVGEHPYMKLLNLSYITSLASCLLFLVHYTLFAKDGCGSKRIRFLAVVTSIVANCTIFLIAILASLGWAVTVFALPARRCFIGTIFVVGVLSALIEFHAEFLVDPSSKIYNYQSGPGVLACVLKIFIFCWFGFQVKITHDGELHDQLRRYYKVLGISVSLWALNVPLMVMVAFYLYPWQRYKVVATTELIVRFLGSMLLSWLFCGPLSPITARNTFRAGTVDAMADPPFMQVDDGVRMGT